MKIKINMQAFIKLEVRLSTPSRPPLQADRWDGGFNRSRAFRRAWDVGPSGLGSVLGTLVGVLGTSWRGPGRPRGVLGGLSELLRPPGRLRDGFQGSVGRSWRPLGAPLGRS